MEGSNKLVLHACDCDRLGVGRAREQRPLRRPLRRPAPPLLLRGRDPRPREDHVGWVHVQQARETRLDGCEDLAQRRRDVCREDNPWGLVGGEAERMSQRSQTETPRNGRASSGRAAGNWANGSAAQRQSKHRADCRQLGAHRSLRLL